MIGKDLEVYQANSFIESRQSYSVNEKRLLSTLISFVKPTDTEFVRYEVSVQEWAKLLGVNPKGLYQIADEVTTGLMMKIISIKDPIALTFEKWHVLDTAKYTEGILTLSIDKKMNDIFLNLKASKNYTHYELTEFVTLTSTYAQRIYELMKQYQHSKKKGRTIELDELRSMLGVGQDDYKLFSNFRKKVLDIALKQIEEKTTLRYKWEGVTKRGRKVHAIRFYDIHEAGKDTATDLQEVAFLKNYTGQEIYNEKFGNFITISSVTKNKNQSYTVIDKFDNCSYDYPNLEALQSSIAKAQIQKRLF